MTARELYEVWAPEGSLWSAWVAPAIFSGFECEAPNTPQLPAIPIPLVSRQAVVLDLPGDQAVLLGLALATEGYQPVPVFNVSPAPDWGGIVTDDILLLHPISPPGIALDLKPVVRALCQGATVLRSQALPANAPPAFLLDSRRLEPQVPIDEGTFDNRWMVFPQDFPSGRFLRERRIESLLLVQQGRLEPRVDLAHVLLRWQEAGMQVLGKDLTRTSPPEPLHISRPPLFRALWYRALAQLGLHPNSAGAFGAIVPPTSAG